MCFEGVASGLNAVKGQTKNKCCTIFLTNHRAPDFFADIIDETQLKAEVKDAGSLPTVEFSTA